MLILCFSLSLIFGAITIVAGILGLLAGCLLSQKLSHKYPKADPLICAGGLLVSAPLLCGAMFTIDINQYLCFTLLFLGQVSLNLNWAIVTDILLVRTTLLPSYFFSIIVLFYSFILPWRLIKCQWSIIFCLARTHPLHC